MSAGGGDCPAGNVRTAEVLGIRVYVTLTAADNALNVYRLSLQVLCRRYSGVARNLVEPHSF